MPGDTPFDAASNEALVEALARHLCESGPVWYPWHRAPEWRRIGLRGESRSVLTFLAKHGWLTKDGTLPSTDISGERYA